MISLAFRDRLPQHVLDELEQLTQQINTQTHREHKEDGSHGNMSADTIDLGGAPLGVWQDTPFEATDYSGDTGLTLTVAPENVLNNRWMRVQKTIFWNIELRNVAVTGSGASFYIKLPEGMRGPERGRSINFAYALNPPQTASIGGFCRAVVEPNADVLKVSLDMVEGGPAAWGEAAIEVFVVQVIAELR